MFHRSKLTKTLAKAVIAALVCGGSFAVMSDSENAVAADSSPTVRASEPPAETRDIYQWPFTWDSIWNLPLAKTAEYQPFDTRSSQVYIDYEDVSVDPDFPIKTLTENDRDKQIRVHVDPKLEADGSWNNCASLLVDTPDKKTIVQGQPMKLKPGGDPSWDYSWDELSLTGKGFEGCHGGSGLSGLGGDIRAGEMPGDKPLRHALKIGLNCKKSCSPENNGFRWPANKSDSGSGNYHGTDPKVNMGSLLAVPPDADLDWITEPDVRKVAEALRTYGGYVVDDTASAEDVSIDVQHGYENEVPNINSAQMKRLFRELSVVTNNTEQSPGGGTLTSQRLAECAPAFADGTGGAPPACGAKQA